VKLVGPKIFLKYAGFSRYMFGFIFGCRPVHMGIKTFQKNFREAISVLVRV
jgi:hypothetical protein